MCDCQCVQRWEGAEAAAPLDTGIREFLPVLSTLSLPFENQPVWHICAHSEWKGLANKRASGAQCLYVSSPGSSKLFPDSSFKLRGVPLSLTWALLRPGLWCMRVQAPIVLFTCSTVLSHNPLRNGLTYIRFQGIKIEISKTVLTEYGWHFMVFNTHIITFLPLHIQIYLSFLCPNLSVKSSVW